MRPRREVRMRACATLKIPWPDGGGKVRTDKARRKSFAAADKKGLRAYALPYMHGALRTAQITEKEKRQ